MFAKNKTWSELYRVILWSQSYVGHERKKTGFWFLRNFVKLFRPKNLVDEFTHLVTGTQNYWIENEKIFSN
jgi:hypothetical protein